MLDCVIKGGTVVDGTGAPARPSRRRHPRRPHRRGRRRHRRGAPRPSTPAGSSSRPGIVDPHTHYDAQLFWDPAASPSNLHGVTSMIAGNCGFTLAPIAPGRRRLPAPHDGQGRGHAAARARDRRAVELAHASATTSARSTATSALNVGLPRRPLRAAPQRDGRRQHRQRGHARRSSTRCSRCSTSRSRAGGLGFSTTLSFTHSDGDGQPVASRWASNDEVLALCRAVSEHEGTTLEYVTDGCLRGFTDAEIDLMAEMTLAGRRPLNWNVLTIDSDEPQRYHDQLAACENAPARGGTAVALTMPILVEMNMTFRTYCALFMLPGWSDVMNLPVPERIAKLRDPEVRRWMDERAHSQEAGVFSRLASWGRLPDRRHLLRRQRGPEGPRGRRPRGASRASRRSTRWSTS